MRNLGMALVGAAFLMAGCASTNTPEDLGELQYTGFSTKADGSAHQTVMGLTCPSEIDGIRRTSTNVYNDGGTDVSCNYSQDERIFTVYLSRFPGDSLGGYFQGSDGAVKYTVEARGFVYDEELSDTCSAESLDMTSILLPLLSGENTSNTITLSPTPSAVYVNPAEGKVSVLVVEEMYEEDFFKTRYTGPYSGEEDVEKVCKLVRDNYLNMKASVGEARGLEVSDADKMLGFINSTNEGS